MCCFNMHIEFKLHINQSSFKHNFASVSNKISLEIFKHRETWSQTFIELRLKLQRFRKLQTTFLSNIVWRRQRLNDLRNHQYIILYSILSYIQYYLQLSVKCKKIDTFSMDVYIYYIIINTYTDYTASKWRQSTRESQLPLDDFLPVSQSMSFSLLIA